MKKMNQALLYAAAAPVLLHPAVAAPVRPNFIVILIDDMGWRDSSTYGSDYYETPNLTRMAKEGMLFTDAYAAAPLCSPTRASILSGQYPARLRMTVAITSKDVPVPKALPPEGDKYCGLVENRNYMPLEIITLAERLKVSGYQTAHIGKWHLSPSGKQWKETGDQYNAEHQGFDFVIGGDHLPGPPDYYSPYKNGIRNLSPRPAGEYLNERLAQESIKWITSVKDSGKPFYLNFWHYAVHGPIIPKKDLLPKYVGRRDPKKDQRCPEMGTMLESMDLSIGILLDWLDQPENRSVKENTVILLTSDNGGVIHNEINGNPWTSNRPLRGGKANLYEGGVRVPWIVRWPGNIQAGTVCKTPVQSVDVYPTVLEIAGLKPSPETLLDGQSFVPLLKGKTMDRQPVFTHFPHLFGILCAPSTSVRAGDYKLIRYHHAGENAASPAYELFDLKRDPYESVNLAGYMPDKVAELDLLIEQFLKKTDALVPLRNPAFAGNPQTPRSNAQQAPDRPQSLRLAETEMVTGEAGRRILQLTDERNRPCKTHALVLEGSGWVRTETRPDGRVEVIWDTPPANAAARVLFGWCGGATAFEVNDWTHPPCELVIRSASGTNKN